MRVGRKAKTLASRGDQRGALAIYTAFLDSHPDSALGLNNAACLCLEMENPQEARQFLERAVKVDPEYSTAWSNLGAARATLGDLVGAQQALQNALRLDPANELTRKQLEAVQATSMVDGRSLAASGPAYRLRGAAQGTSVEYVCALCGQRFTSFGRWAPDNPAVGGARCRSCGAFFCDRCANRIVPLDTKGKKLHCTCGVSFLTRGVENEWEFHNFVELVVFQAPGAPRESR